ncbi:SDR family oxidoreductase [Halomicrococcus sp. NG-SE-24]|uniref:SDR family oxidoreductase n=1 Tax=Halomicrococcus sp. NG-SE-24 TaxID=3436928 RepID=UPI003D9725DC
MSVRLLSTTDQVRFNAVCPGSVIGDSDIWQEREEEHPGMLQDIEDIYPLGRYGQPEDIAEAIWVLTTERASWITGVVFPVDSGLSAAGNMPGDRWWEQL